MLIGLRPRLRRREDVDGELLRHAGGSVVPGVAARVQAVDEHDWLLAEESRCIGAGEQAHEAANDDLSDAEMSWLTTFAPRGRWCIRYQ